jgi:hypothetical protein
MLRLHLCKEMYRQRRNHAEKRQISLHKQLLFTAVQPFEPFP